MMQKDTDQFTFIWTRKQLHEVRQALKKRLGYLRQGARQGIVEQQEIFLVEALLQDIKEKLDNESISTL